MKKQTNNSLLRAIVLFIIVVASAVSFTMCRQNGVFHDIIVTVYYGCPNSKRVRKLKIKKHVWK